MTASLIAPDVDRRGKLASDTNHASTTASLMHPGLLSLLGVKLGCEGLLSLRILLALGVCRMP
jgi:hypothetical protein